MLDHTITRTLLAQPAAPDGALLAALALASRALWAAQTSPQRADGSALAQLHLAVAQDELAPLGAPPELDHHDLDTDQVTGLLTDLAAALRRTHHATGRAALLVAAHHVAAALSSLAGVPAPS